MNYSYPENTTLLIYWGEPTYPNGVILQYHVVIQELGGSIVENVTLSPTVMNLTINTTGTFTYNCDSVIYVLILDFKVYEITVSAATSQGFGDTSQLIVYPKNGCKHV